MYTLTHPHQESGGSKASIGVLNRGSLSLTEIRIICVRCQNGESVSTLIWTHRQYPSHCSPVTVFCVITKEEQKGCLQGASWSLGRRRRSLTLLVATHWEQGLCFGQAGWVWLVCKASVTAVQVAVFQHMWHWPDLCDSHAAQDSKQAHRHVLTTSSNSGPTILKFHSELSKSSPKLGWQSDTIWSAFLGGWVRPCPVSVSWWRHTVERTRLQLAQPCGHIYCPALARLRHPDI